jgi:hypothetical protein
MTFQRLLGLGHRRPRRDGHLANAVAGIAAGAGLMYFLDPGRGARRRADVAQRAGRALHDVEATVEAGARDLRHRAAGLAHEAKARVAHEAASDEVLAERVRAKLGRVTAHPRAVRVEVKDGRVSLAGPVLAAEHGRVVRSVRLVRGVRGVEDRLQPHASAEGVTALQGGGPAPGPRPELLQGRWAPGTRLLAGAAGAFLALRALFGRGVGRIPAGVAGAALLGRSMGDSTAGAGLRRAAREAGAAARRAGERRGDEEAHRGAWHTEPEVREAKSPAELEPGIASATPEPTFESRVSRRGSGGSGARRKRRRLDAAAAEEGAPTPGAEDVASRAGYVAPGAGAGVREADLGATESPEDALIEREDRGAGGEAGAERREPDEGER